MKYHLVTYCSRNYQPAFESSIPSWLASDAETINIYTDGWDTQAYTGVTTYPIFQPCNDRGTHCVRKSEALLRFCADNTDKRHVVMLDVDCYILGHLAHVFQIYGQFDVAVTVYKNVKQKHRLKNVSAGVLFIKNAPQTRRFLRQWIMDQQSDCYQTPCRDQRCLSLLLHRNPLKLNIKQLDYNVWNAHANPTVRRADNHSLSWLENIDEHCGILHLARGLWKNKELVERFVYG